MTSDLTIGFVYGGALDPEFVRSLFKTVTTIERLHGVIMQPSPSGMVPASRNAVVREFLQGPTEWLLWLNTDKVWQPEMVLQIIGVAEENQWPIVSAHIRNPGPSQHLTVPVMVDEFLQPIEPDPAARYLQVYCAGMGFFLTQRWVFEKMASAYTNEYPCEWFDYETWAGKTTGEDLVFSRRLKALDIPIMVDQALRIGHRKTIALYPPELA